jgi:hypothetical protein
MNLLSTIIERLNQRVEAGNIFDQIYGLCELSADGNDKAWIHYIGNGQAIPVTNFDAKQGTIFWAKRGKISVSKNESLKLAGCKALYETKFTLSAYAVVRKDHLPCDSADAQDWIASRVLRLVSGTDPQFKTAIGVVAYEVVPNGYVNEIKSLTANYEWACVSIDVDVNVLTSSEDGCYDTCATGDIPLPDFEPCTPCLTEVAVDGVTITGNGTTEDPLVAVGGGGGGSLRVQDEGTTVTNAATTLNFTGNVTASLASAGNVTVNVPAETPQVNADWNASSGVAEILNKPTIPNPQVNADWNASSGVAQILNKPTLATVATSGSYTDLINQPSIPPAQVNSDWNASSGVAEILNKPSIPAAQIQSDWNQANNAALDFIKNKPTITTGTVESVNSGININVDNTDPDNPIINSLADRYKTTSTTSNSVSNGSKNFTVDLNLSYIPLQEILIVHNPANHMHGEVTSYNPATGALVVDIKNHTGSGTYTSWALNLDGTPVDALTGSGTANEIAYFTAARVLSSLPVATYPSLTELSYVKGVSSAIQTQLNGKQATLSAGTGISLASNTVTNTAPDQTVVVNAGAGIGVTGTYPNFTIANTLPALPIKQVIGSATETSGTAITQLSSLLIEGGWLTANMMAKVFARNHKVGANNGTTIRLYLNDANNLTGAVLLATFGAALNGASSFSDIMRRITIVSSTETYVVLTSTSSSNDIGNFQTSILNVNWTTDKYLIATGQDINGSDVTKNILLQIEKYVNS